MVRRPLLSLSTTAVISRADLMHQLVVSERTSFNTNNNGSSCPLSSLFVDCRYVCRLADIRQSDNLFNVVVCCGGPHGALLLAVFLLLLVLLFLLSRRNIYLPT